MRYGDDYSFVIYIAYDEIKRRKEKKSLFVLDYFIIFSSKNVFILKMQSKHSRFCHDKRTVLPVFSNFEDSDGKMVFLRNNVIFFEMIISEQNFLCHQTISNEL